MIETEVTAFLARSVTTGSCLDKGELQSLNSQLNGLIPAWFIELVTKHAVSGLEIAWQASQPEKCFDGIELVTILDIPLLRECNLESYPGKLLWPLGYFTFGYGTAWAGNCFAFKTGESIDPPVYEVWHDAAQDSDGMINSIKERKGVKLASQSFSGFFRNSTFT